MTIQEFAAAAIEKAAEDLITAARALPEETRAWTPLDKGRTAIDQVAECAMINGGTAEVVAHRAWQEVDLVEWRQAHAALNTLEAATTRLRVNTTKLAEAVRSAPDDALAMEITLPWATRTLAEIFLLPYWNMAYHEGQVNYIKTLAG